MILWTASFSSAPPFGCEAHGHRAIQNQGKKYDQALS